MIAGFGFRGAATEASLRDALTRASAGRKVTLLSAPQDKAASPGLTALARALQAPILGIPPDQLAAQRTLTRSAPSLERRAAGSVAEAAALAAAGPGGRLLGPRAISADRMAVCAIAVKETR